MVRPPEDAILRRKKKTNGSDEETKVVKQTSSDSNEDGNSSQTFQVQDRWDRIVRNDLENIPMGLILAWAAYSADTQTLGKWFEYCIMIFIILFTLARFVHTYFYAYQIQPWRTISFIVCQCCQGTFGVLLLIEGINNIK